MVRKSPRTWRSAWWRTQSNANRSPNRNAREIGKNIGKNVQIAGIHIEKFIKRLGMGTSEDFESPKINGKKIEEMGSATK